MLAPRKTRRRRPASVSRRGRLVSEPMRRRLGFETLEDRRLLAVVTVDNALDVINGNTSSIASLIANDGDDGISLREALTAANATAGKDTINFSISGQIITPESALPLITDSVVIDATTAPGYVGEPLITLDGIGAGAAAGLYVLSSAPNSEIHGLSVIRFTDGIVLESNDNLVSENYVGISPSGGTGVGNAFDGIILFNVSGNLITENVISGNSRHGLSIDGSGSNVVTNNRIGTDADGLTAVGNAGDGVQIFNSSGNQIGGVVDTDRNIISGNQQGVTIIGSTAPASNNAIQGNYIGTDVTGLQEIPNLDDGIQLWNVTGASNGAVTGNLIGGDDDDDGSLDGIVRARNIISGNTNEGIALFGSEVTQNHIEGNWIGLSADGQAALPNSIGVNITNPAGEPPSQAASSNTIGGTSVGAGNVISGNSRDGIQFGFGTFSNLVLGNFIGTDVSGGGDPNAPLNLGNSRYGILISDATDNLVGGVTTAERNVIAGNLGHGVAIKPGGFALPTVRNQVLGNYIGVLIDGVTELGNDGSGVSIEEASDNVIGGTAVGAGNVISGNFRSGVEIAGAGATINRVEGNWIGVAANGVDPLGNLGQGIVVTQDASANIIGDPVGDAGNVIAFNGVVLDLQGHGVVIESGVSNQIRKNSIYSNSGRGIDLGNDSFTVNDYLDVYGGGNAFQNFPVVSKVGFAGPVKTITWSLTGPALATFTLDFFASDSLDPSGFGEGKTYLSSLTVAADADGLVSQPTVFDSSHQFISATATDFLGNTSEFSMVDTDGDALADAWELTGINFDEDDAIDLPLNSNPNHKDIFVEVDAMVGRAPDPGALIDVVAAFASAPNSLVQNPDGENGITLHAALDETNTTLYSFPNGLVDARVVKLARFGTVAERGDANSANILAAKRLTHRWSIFADTSYGNPTSGEGELPGNDFFVSLGLWNTASGMPGGTRQQQAGTFMHELGHTLGLRHGGEDDIGFKPNYHSVMNYIWQTPGQRLPPTARPANANEQAYIDSWVLDFSREAFPDLDQHHLIEDDGIGGHPGRTVRIESTSSYVKENGPVDWDNDGLSNETVEEVLTPGSRFVLTGHEDWSNLQYSFVETNAFASGASATSPNDELTFELWQSFVDWHALPGDYDLSGTVDAADLTEWQDTFGQAAISPYAYADGNGNSLIDGADFLAWQGNFGSDLDDPGQLQFLQPSYTVSETAGVFNVTVERIGGIQGAITVDYELEDGTALSTQDYVDASGTLSFADGQTSQFISVQIINDALAEDDEYFNITLSNPTGGASLGNPSTTTFTISESEPPIVVTNNNDSGGGSLRRAIQTANLRPGDDTITFDTTVFATPQTILLETGEFDISEAVTIDGPGQQFLTIDAQQQSRIFNIMASTGDFTLAGLSILGGRTTVDEFGKGGAIRSLTTERLFLDQSTVSGSSTVGVDSGGGGIYSYGDITLTQSTVSGNSTSGIASFGGGIFSYGDITLTQSTVSSNSTTGESGEGGGIHTFGDNVTLISSIVSGNSTTGDRSDGGGIYIFNGYVTLTDSTVSDNSTLGDSAKGGGIRSWRGVTLTNSTVSGNNTVGSDSMGGGIYVGNGALTITQSTVSGNGTAGETNRGGGGISSFGDVTLIQSTVTGNYANYPTSVGGGIWSRETITLTGSIVAGNTAAGGMQDIGGDPDLYVDFSLIEQTGLTITGSDNIVGQSANLGPLASNGGPTQTHSLLAGSPAIDAGDSSIVFSPNEFDQRSAPFVRVFGGRIDIGAFESQPIAISADFDTDVGGQDFLAKQRGLGTSNAQKADGNDLDVDGDDLGVWLGQYGTVPPLVALRQESSAESPVPEIGPQWLLNSELVGLALAVEAMGQTASEDDLFVEVQPNEYEVVRDAVFGAGDVLASPVRSAKSESLSARSDAEDTEEEAWLSDNLLEQVFG